MYHIQDCTTRANIMVNFYQYYFGIKIGSTPMMTWIAAYVGCSVWNGAIKATHPNKCYIACGRSSQHTQISLEERAFVPSGHAWLGHGVMPPHQCKTVDIYHLSSKAFSLQHHCKPLTFGFLLLSSDHRHKEQKRGERGRNDNTQE